MPGSALRLLNQGRAQGLFTPSTSDSSAAKAQALNSPSPYYGSGFSQSPFSQTPPPSSLKRNRSEADADAIMSTAHGQLCSSANVNKSAHHVPRYFCPDPRSPSNLLQVNGEENPSPAKRQRRDESPSQFTASQTESWPASSQTQATSLPSTQQSTNLSPMRRVSRQNRPLHADWIQRLP